MLKIQIFQLNFNNATIIMSIMALAVQHNNNLLYTCTPSLAKPKHNRALILLFRGKHGSCVVNEGSE